ncbi:hypothetical protein I4F81_003786 [Pyropia yezoensis]|uniref:Uncharacterized protein n=1 Tax=Pyropia yezoensis TaxID=2788 RepID=A0ACC3BTL9_PYRYE|nr:hypothetical protein I4F81_003786 [Neopyropia yezoensis]
MTAHAEFRHLVDAGRFAVLPAPGSAHTSGEDESGHGTHVAGTIAGRGTGVAPGVRLTCVKVLNGTGHGTITDVLSALDVATGWAAGNPNSPVLFSASLADARSVDGRVLLSGTSMAAPHVTGLAALLMAEGGGRRRLSAGQVVAGLSGPGGVRVGGTPLAWLDPTACEEAGGAGEAAKASTEND